MEVIGGLMKAIVVVRGALFTGFIIMSVVDSLGRGSSNVGPTRNCYV